MREMPELIHGWVLQWRKEGGRLVLDVTALHQNIPVTHLPQHVHVHHRPVTVTHSVTPPVTGHLRYPSVSCVYSPSTHHLHAFYSKSPPTPPTPRLFPRTPTPSFQHQPPPPPDFLPVAKQSRDAQNDVYWRVSQRRVMGQGAG